MSGQLPTFAAMRPLAIDPHQLAEQFIAFCNGLEEAGMTTYAQVGRTVADELVRALERADVEHTLRLAMQERGDEWYRLWSVAATDLMRERGLIE